ncbi:glutamate decarboxylase-like protein [Tanacetum coccineum]
MVISSTNADYDQDLHSTFASRYVRTSLPSDELMLDGNPRLNLASFVTTWMEPECDKLIMSSINKNYVDMDEYPVTTELQNRCVNMIAHLFHAPVGEDDTAVGVGTVGSSEAIMLAGSRLQKEWQQEKITRKKTYAGPTLYFEVDLKEVKLKEGYYVMDPVKAVEMVDENTICVAAILGSTMTGEFEDVKLLNDLLMCVDFRLPLVKSINVSGHKYGLVYAGVGWIVWRTKEDLPDELVFHINYLGSDQPTFTLNFSKGSSQIIAQYYQFIRLGFEGYKDVMMNCSENTRTLKEGLQKTGRFDIISKDIGVPLLAFSLKDSSRYSVFDISESLRRFGWIVPAYTMPPDAQHISVLRVVIREDFSHSLAERLIADIVKVVNELEAAQPTNNVTSVHNGEASEHKVREMQKGITKFWRFVHAAFERSFQQHSRSETLVISGDLSGKLSSPAVQQLWTLYPGKQTANLF